MRHFVLFLFSVAGGLALSGIVANLYRILASKPLGRAATWTYYSVMVLAGPTVLVNNSTRSFRRKECTRMAYGFALGLAVYWSFLLGFGLVELRLAF